MSRSRLHRKALRVLPEPVGATTSAWLPAPIASQAPTWAGVGSANAAANHARVGSVNRASPGWVADMSTSLADGTDIGRAAYLPATCQVAAGYLWVISVT